MTGIKKSVKAEVLGFKGKFLCLKWVVCFISGPKINFFKLFSIIPDDKHLKVGKNDYFGFWGKIHIRLKIGSMVQVIEPGVHCYFVFVFIVIILMRLSF